METAKTPLHASIKPLLSHPVKSEENAITKYSNRIQGFAYGGAAVLVVIIGLRSVYGRAIPSWVVISGLLLEAVLLLLIAAVYYFTPEEKGGGQPSTESKILNSEKEILGLLRNNVLQGEGEILKVLRHGLVSQQQDMLQAIRSNTEALQQQQKSLDHIDEQITTLLRNEVDSIVQAKVQQLFSELVRRETDRGMQGKRNE